MSKFHTHTKNNIHLDVKFPSFRPIHKQLITEEKIAAHMSRLHISGTSAQEPLLPNSSPEPPISPPQSEKTSENVLERLVKGGSRLVLAEEVQNLRQESCLPPALLEHLYVLPKFIFVFFIKQKLYFMSITELDQQWLWSCGNPLALL
jgi:hypothetical protein